MMLPPRSKKSRTKSSSLNKKMNDAGIPHIVSAPPQPRGGRGGEEEFDK
jgi:hypothetical protein